MHLTFRNVNNAFTGLVKGFHTGDFNGQTPQLETMPSRAGEVVSIREPVTITYERPLERVLFNRGRDANPFFHLFESLWMLAGRNDVAPLKYFNSKIDEVASDDGKTFNGAYGYRWRNGGNQLFSPSNPMGRSKVDQVQVLIQHLKDNPHSRRAVLEMWAVEDDLLKVERTKDVCCNTHAYFDLDHCQRCWGSGTKLNDMVCDECEGSPKTLNMTVCNRSNDLIWGMLGANVVHFSLLQEYMAAALGAEVGVYNQFTNNLHVYTERWDPETWLEDDRDCYIGGQEHGYPLRGVPLLEGVTVEEFDRDVAEFIDKKEDGYYQSSFLSNVASPMCLAFRHHKERDYLRAGEALERVAAEDWQIAAAEWINRRGMKWSAKQGQIVDPTGWKGPGY